MKNKKNICCTDGEPEKRKTTIDNVYGFMQKIANDLDYERDIESTFVTRGSFGLCVLVNKDICTLHACKKDLVHYSEPPICKGSLNDIIAYLNDRDNAEDVLFAMEAINKRC